ncbi:MAG TPA: insulinase family protein [Candidatus Limnocylindria bacterium]|nr:insulinase family protein [Candidatus Limnocylindria bacterium]
MMRDGIRAAQSVEMFLGVKIDRVHRVALIMAWIAAFFIGGALELQAAQAKAAKRRVQPAKSTQPAKTVKPAKAAQVARSFDIDFKEFTLKNGLRVLIAEDHSAPTYSITMTYNVGSRDEKPGLTGFAHLFEHMLFQGSENVGKGEHFILVQNNGGSANGTTTPTAPTIFKPCRPINWSWGYFSKRTACARRPSPRPTSTINGSPSRKSAARATITGPTVKPTRR